MKNDIKERWSLLFFVFVLGMFIGVIIWSFRASAYYNDVMQVKEYSFNKVISETHGNVSSLENTRKPFSCFVFNDEDTTLRFHYEVLIETLKERPVCFKGG